MTRGRRSEKKVRGYVSYWSDDHQQQAALGTYTDVFSLGELAATQFAIMVSDDDLEAFGILTRGDQVATAKRRGRYTDIYELSPPLPLGEIEEAAAESRLPKEALDGGALPPQKLTDFLAAVRAARPELGAPVDVLLGRLASQSPTAQRGAEVIGFERDAVGVALDIAGLTDTRRRLLGQRRPPAPPAPFLQGVGEGRELEDHLIVNDLRVFGDWAEIETGDPIVTEFASGDRRVTIANLNRTPVETSTGADLIYYSHEWNSYVLVQYKRMLREKREGWVFRPSLAGKLEQELANLRLLPRGEEAPERSAEFRLSDEAGYLKLCRDLRVDPGSRQLATGHYLPVSHYDLLVADPSAVGPKRGVRLTLAGMSERWLTNDTFVDLVRRGFIGSREIHTDDITAQIKLGLAQGHSVTLAASADADDADY